MRGYLPLVGLILSFCAVTAFSQSQKKTRPTASPKPSPVTPFTPKQIVDRVLPSVVLVVAQDRQGDRLVKEAVSYSNRD